MDGDPLFDARGTRKYCGDISEMTLWRWSAQHDFPSPDVIIGRRRFWRRSTIDDWIDKMAGEAA
jgi:predicted DNA-binding transcriptional regulator AlpA